MTLTNYWWLLIWVFGGGVFLSIFIPRCCITVLGRKEKRWSIAAALVLILPYIIWAGFRTDDFGDTSAYRLMFAEAPTAISQIPTYLQDVTKDKGFAVLMVVLKLIFGNSDELFFLLIAAFQMLCIALVLRRYSCDYWFSIFLFVATTDYMSWMHNGIRQFLAVALIFAATSLMLKKKHIAVIIVILLASTLHVSALMMIPIYIIVRGKTWNKKTVFLIVISVLVVLLVDRFTGILEILLSDTQYTDAFSEWAASTGDDGTNLLRVLVYSVPLILAIIGRRYIKVVENPMINMMIGFSICTTGLYLISAFSSGILLGRLPVYTSIYSTCILLPWEIENIFNQKSAKFVKGCAIIAFLSFFYYQMHYSWGLL